MTEQARCPTISIVHVQDLPRGGTPTAVLVAQCAGAHVSQCDNHGLRLSAGEPSTTTRLS